MAHSTQIKLFKNVPFDNEYLNIVKFANQTEQLNYFSGLTPVWSTIDGNYKRVSDNVIQLPITEDDARKCNYMAILNYGHSNKWHYCFIEAVKYISDGCTELTFSIDIWQTYQFDIDIKTAFILREHSKTDDMYEHLEPENISTGDEYVSVRQIVKLYPPNFVMACCSRLKKGSTEVKAGLRPYGGVWMHTPCAHGYPVSGTGMAELMDWLEDLTPEEIMLIQMYPELCEDATKTSDYKSQAGFYQCKSEAIQIDKQGIGVNTRLDRYLPKNKKLYNFPYTFAEMTNYSGTVRCFKPEGFAGTQFQFIARASLIPVPSVYVAPLVNYFEGDGFEMGVSVTDYPTINYASDMFRAEILRSKGKIMNNVLSTVGASVVSPQTAVAGVAGNALNFVGNYIDKSGKYTTSGAPSVDGIKLNANKYGVTIKIKTVNYTTAKIIDDYFTKFGYSCNKEKIPNFWTDEGRPHWNYVQTAGITFTGNVTQGVRNELVSIFDRGVTVWDTPENIGNFALDNSPS